MATVAGGWGCALAVLAMLCGAPARAEVTAYKCVARGTVVYSQVPCPGGRPVGTRAAHATDKWKAPPQDRAVVARRARLTPAEREQCGALDGSIAREQASLKSRGEAVTLDDEMPLVRMKREYRELHC